MTKDEDDWLSDFLEAVQASAKQNLAAAEKDYAFKSKLLNPRLQRALARADADGELARKLAAVEALAGQRKFEAALDTLDEAAVIAAGVLSMPVVEAVISADTMAEPMAPPVAEESAPEWVESVEPAPAAESPSLDDILEDLESEDEPLPAEEGSGPVVSDSSVSVAASNGEGDADLPEAAPDELPLREGEETEKEPDA